MFRAVNKSCVSLNEDDFEGVCESDPTLEQIEIETAKIREGWSEKKRQSRRVTKYSQFVAPSIHMDEWAASIASASGSSF
jgi:hypothetical protein